MRPSEVSFHLHFSDTQTTHICHSHCIEKWWYTCKSSNARHNIKWHLMYFESLYVDSDQNVIVLIHYTPNYSARSAFPSALSKNQHSLDDGGAAPGCSRWAGISLIPDIHKLKNRSKNEYPCFILYIIMMWCLNSHVALLKPLISVWSVIYLDKIE